MTPGESVPARPRAAELALALLAAALLLGFGVSSVGVASGYVDPIAKAGAQDEAIYCHSAVAMARGGGWLTPTVLGRFDLHKPPGLLWAGALSMRLFGISPLALRLPVLLAAALCCLAVYLWVRTARALLAAATALLLLVSSPLFHDAARRFTAEGVLVGCLLMALTVLWRDPRLDSNRSVAVFGLLTGGALMVKSAAGLLPWLILVAYCPIVRRDLRPAWRRVLGVACVAALVAAPWHLYELLAHRQWFLTEYVNVQLIRQGLTSPALLSSDSTLVFYLERLVRIDPALCLVFLSALPAIWLDWKRSRSATPSLLAAALAVLALTLGVYGTRIAYFLVPPLAILALCSGLYSPLLRGRAAAVTLAALACLFVVKTQVRGPLWSLDFSPGTTVKSAPALHRYSLLGRSNELVVVAPDDEFYSSVLDLPRVRYLLISSAFGRIPGYVSELGLVMDAGEFRDLPRATALYAPRLKAWGLPDAAPLATTILAHSNDELLAVIRSSPQRDFFLPGALESALPPAIGATHQVAPGGNGYLFLLARESSVRPDPGYTGAF